MSPEILTKELTDLWKYTEYCFRVAGFTRRGDGNLTDCLNITTDQDSKLSYLVVYQVLSHVMEDADTERNAPAFCNVTPHACHGGSYNGVF